MANTRNLLELTLDVTETIPTLEDLRTYGIASMRVRTVGPGGGNPCLTLGFETGAAGHGRRNAERFLAEWMQSEDVEADLAIAIG